MASITTEEHKVSRAKNFVREMSDRLTPFLADYENALANTDLSNNQIENTLSMFVDLFPDYYKDSDYYIVGSTVNDAGEILNTESNKRDFLRRAIFAYKIEDADIRHLFQRKSWSAGTVYAQYDDVEEMENLDFYVTVLEGAPSEGSYRVYKCISNNGGAESTQVPTASGIYSDGYEWEYLFEVPSDEYLKFGYGNYLPYVEDANTISSATQGISKIEIEETPIAMFSNEFNLGQCQVTGIEEDVASNTFTLTIQTDGTSPSTSDNEYTKMYLRFDNIGGLFSILRSETVSSLPGNSELLITISRQADNLPAITPAISFGEQCHILPKIIISRPNDDGGERSYGYGVLDEQSTLSEIILTDKGSGYRTASAYVDVTDSQIAGYGDTSSLRPILSTKGGHGSNPITELFMSRVILHAEIASVVDGSNTNITDTNGYTRLGLVVNPEFSTDTKTVDMRMSITLDGDQTGSISENMILEQEDANEELVLAKVHEVVFNDPDTTVYLYDFINDGNSTFQPGTVRVRNNNPNQSLLLTATINTVTESVYTPFSGDVLHFTNFDQIERSVDNTERAIFVLDF